MKTKHFEIIFLHHMRGTDQAIAELDALNHRIVNGTQRSVSYDLYLTSIIVPAIIVDSPTV
jgi:hypothetical protein